MYIHCKVTVYYFVEITEQDTRTALSSLISSDYFLNPGEYCSG